MSAVCRKVFWLNSKGALLHRVVSAMLADCMSVSTSQWSEERSMVIHLILTTLAGEEAQLTIELHEYDCLQEFEYAVMEQLPELGASSTFCCELDFVCCNSKQKLVDPIWQTLRDCNCFTVVVSPCVEKAEHKRQTQGETKALRVPFQASDRIFPQAFSHLARLRHAQVDAGYRIIGECAWHNCQHLQIVRLDSTVLSLQTRVFSRCYALESSPLAVENLEHKYLKSALPCCKLESTTTLSTSLRRRQSYGLEPSINAQCCVTSTLSYRSTNLPD